MAKYNNARFYWLQLKEDFFDEDAIDWLEEQPNGEKYSLFYLKLCLKSLRTNGILIRQVGTMLVPYDHIKLGELTKTDPDTVLVALELLFKIGLVSKLENGALYIRQVENMIGSQSIGAFKKQQQIMRRENNLIEGGKEVEILPPNIDIDKEKELDKEEKKDNVGQIPTNVQLIFDYWNTKNIIVHRELTEDFKKAIDKALKKYSVEDIKKYIDRYATVLNDKDYYFDTKWSLGLFLTRKGGIADFTDEGSKWASYLNRQQNKNKRNDGGSNSNGEDNQEIINRLSSKFTV